MNTNLKPRRKQWHKLREVQNILVVETTCMESYLVAIGGPRAPVDALVILNSKMDKRKRGRIVRRTLREVSAR